MTGAELWEYDEIGSVADLVSTHSVVTSPSGSFIVATAERATFYSQDGTTYMQDGTVINVPTPPAIDSLKRGEI
jgi:hypothetical protein